MTKQKLLKILGILLVILGTILIKPVAFKMAGIFVLMILTFIFTDMKNHSLFKTISILLLYTAISSFVLVGRNEVLDYIGLGNLVFNTFKSVNYFFYMIVFALSVGGFYGVLNKTPAYKKMLDNIVAKLKPFGKRIIFIMISVIAILAAITGLSIPLFIFIPFVVSIILLLGYDKLVALSSTLGSILVGYVGGLFVTIVNPNTNDLTTYEAFVGTSEKFENIFPKLLLLFAGIALLVYFVNKHIINVENKKVKYELNENKDLVINEVTGNYKDIKVWPLAIIFSIMFIFIIIGLIPWNSLFEINIFNEFHTWLTGITNNFSIFNNIISNELPALGEWFTSGDSLGYMTLSIVLLVFALIISLTNRVKFNEFIEEYGNGMKKILPATIIMIMCYALLVSSYMNGFYETLVSNYGQFNYGISSLFAILGSVLYTDIYYVAISGFLPIINTITDESIYASVAILFQGIYGIFQLVGPTSIMLVLCLSYFDIPYTTWIKYIWRFILSLIILLAIVTMLVVLL